MIMLTFLCLISASICRSSPPSYSAITCMIQDFACQNQATNGNEKPLFLTFQTYLSKFIKLCRPPLCFPLFLRPTFGKCKRQLVVQPTNETKATIVDFVKAFTKLILFPTICRPFHFPSPLSFGQPKACARRL